ncbi:MAG: hypothetical protein WBA77_17765 [Microcoleaceae cyanobacterium]
MTIIFTPNIRLLEYDPELISDFNIDSPKSGVQTTDNTLNLSGWVVGKTSAAVAIELVKNNQVILEEPIKIHRPRVAQRYPQIPGSQKSGFQISISLSEVAFSSSEINLKVVLGDTKRVAIAIMSCESRQQDYQKKTFFIHVAKTAGSSFNQFLRTHFRGDDHCEKYRNNGQQAQFKEIDKLRSLDYISGHLTYKEFKRDFKREDYFLVTLLRNPIHQVISHLNWVYHVGEDVDSDFFKSHPRHDQDIILSVRQKNLSNPKEVIQALSEHKGLFLNNQSRYFQTQNKLNEKNIIENLSNFDLVGLTEEYKYFILSYIEMQKMNIKPNFDFQNRNNSPVVNPESLSYNPEFLEFINEYNSVDIKVFRYFKEQERSRKNKLESLLKLREIEEDIHQYKSSLDQIKYSIYR